jgi:RimJ/RimL family protein N-acetyltransferase
LSAQPPRRLRVAPVELAGNLVRLTPMQAADAPALAAVGLDPELWRWIPTPVTSAEDMRAYVQAALDEARLGTALPFTIRSIATGETIGSTRFANVRAEDLGLEIGWTWFASSWQRTGANSETKLLMLTHAFETLGAVRVELKTDRLNTRSRRAIERLGAVEEGVFRKHRVLAHQGRIRDTVYYSIVDEEWPGIKARLAGMLAAREQNVRKDGGRVGSGGEL